MPAGHCLLSSPSRRHPSPRPRPPRPPPPLWPLRPGTRPPWGPARPAHPTPPSAPPPGAASRLRVQDSVVSHLYLMYTRAAWAAPSRAQDGARCIFQTWTLNIRRGTQLTKLFLVNHAVSFENVEGTRASYFKLTRNARFGISLENTLIKYKTGIIT